MRAVKYSGRRTKRTQLATAFGCGVEALEKRTLLSGTPLYWNPGPVNQGPGPGGEGDGPSPPPAPNPSWDTSATNLVWHTGSPTGPAVAWDNSGDYQAVFPADEASTISVNADITVGSIVFADDGYTLTGSQTLTLAGDTSQIDVAWNDTAIIDVPIHGTAGLVKTDDGTLMLSEPNTYTGGTAVLGGVLGLSSAGTLGSPSNRLELDGRIDLGGTGQTVAGLSGTGILTNGDLTIPGGIVSGDIGIYSNAILDVTGENDGEIDIYPADFGANELEIGAGTFTNNGTIDWNTPVDGDATAPPSSDGGNLVIHAGGALINNSTIEYVCGSLTATEGCITNNGSIAFAESNLDGDLLAAINNDNGTITFNDDYFAPGSTLSGGNFSFPTYSQILTNDLDISNATVTFSGYTQVTDAFISLGSGSVVNVPGTLAFIGDDPSQAGISLQGGATLDVSGTLIISSAALEVGSGTFVVGTGGQLNLSDDSVYDTNDDATVGINGNVAIDGQNIFDPVSGASTVPEHSEYTLNLGADGSGTWPVASWSVDWGDGSTPDSYSVADIAATHTFALGVDTPTLQISATTPAVWFDCTNGYLPAGDHHRRSPRRANEPCSHRIHRGRSGFKLGLRREYCE